MPVARRISAARTAKQQQVVDYFAPMIRRRANAVVTFSLVATAMALALQLLPCNTARDRWIMIGCSLALFAPCAYGAFEALKDRTQHPALTTIFDRPLDVVWVYEETMLSPQRLRPMYSSLMVCTRQGKKLPLLCMKGREREALDVLAPLLPNAYLGFDHDIERQFSARYGR